MQKNWKTAVTDFLQDYRATPHATTGVSPSELLHNRKIRTKLDVFPVKDKSKTCKMVISTVEKQQNRSKQCTDKCLGAKPSVFKPGDWLTVKRPEQVHKGTPKFTEPFSIQGQMGLSTYVLNDNKKWNAS